MSDLLLLEDLEPTWKTLHAYARQWRQHAIAEVDVVRLTEPVQRRQRDVAQRLQLPVLVPTTTSWLRRSTRTWNMLPLGSAIESVWSAP